MTEERLAELEKKWSQQFDGHEVVELIREVRRLEERCCVGSGEAVAVNGNARCAKHGKDGQDGLHIAKVYDDQTTEMHAGGYASCIRCHPDLDKSLPRT